MQAEDSRQIALSLIQRYGMQAQAVANQRAAETQAAGDAGGLDKWRQIHDLICELRRTERARREVVH